MAKKDLLREAQKAGHVPEGASEDDYTVADLEALLGGGFKPYGTGPRMATKPVIGPDGHVHLSQEDIDARA